jgi:hypothetical protein
MEMKMGEGKGREGKGREGKEGMEDRWEGIIGDGD